MLLMWWAVNRRRGRDQQGQDGISKDRTGDGSALDSGVPRDSKSSQFTSERINHVDAC